MRLWSGWAAVALIAAATLTIWLVDIGLPLGNSDDGRLVAFSGLHARNFWELGPIESKLGARVDPFVRPDFGTEPRAVAPVHAVTYAHHPPLKEWLSILAAGALGDSPAALRVPIMLLGVSTLLSMASLLRACRLAWGPTLAAIASLACTGFFYVYGRLGVSFSLLVAAAAAVAWTRQSPRPSRLALAGLAVLAALAAMQSWINIAALGPLALWLGIPPPHHDKPPRQPALTRRSAAAWLAAHWTPKLTAFAAGAAVGLAITGAWMLWATGLSELVGQVDTRTGTTAAGLPDGFSFGEFLQRQWRFATEELLVPPWLRVLLVPALVAGLADRRTRAATAITLAVAAALTFGIRQGAWIHRLWNFPWLVPTTIGLAVLADHAQRRLRPTWRRAAAAASAAIITATMLAVITGSTRDRYLTDPAHVGRALEQAAAHPATATAEIIWAGPSLPAPRWASYYLNLPVFHLEDRTLTDLRPSDIIVVRTNRLPPNINPQAFDAPLAASGDYAAITAAAALATNNTP